MTHLPILFFLIWNTLRLLFIYVNSKNVYINNHIITNIIGLGLIFLPYSELTKIGLIIYSMLPLVGLYLTRIYPRAEKLIVRVTNAVIMIFVLLITINHLLTATRSTHNTPISEPFPISV
jgi:hypothetical protein